MDNKENYESAPKFNYDVIQPFIDDPKITDIKICAPDDIRLKTKDNIYRSNASFFNETNLIKFIDKLFIRNHIDANNSIITFIDPYDEHYTLKIAVTEDFINHSNCKCVHIRKIPK